MAEPRRPSRILMVRPSALGDVCRTVPVLASLRRAYPEAAIDWVVRERFVEAVSAHPALNGVIAFPRSRFAGSWRDPAAFGEMVRWFGGLRRGRYDLVIDCQGLGRSGLMTWVTGAPRRVGFQEAREFGWMGYNVRHRVARSMHTVDRMLALLEREGIEAVRDMRVYAPDVAQRWWEGHRGECGLGSARYAVLSPTASRASKRWPIERWGEVREALLDRGFNRVVVIGGPGEREQVRGLEAVGGARDSGVVNLVGATTVGEMMAVIAEADLVIGNDSAPLHMAVGFDRPCVGLFGPTDPALVGPYRRPEAVVRKHEPGAEKGANYRDRRLNDSLMGLISVGDVVERVDAVLASVGESGEPGRGGKVERGTEVRDTAW